MDHTKRLPQEGGKSFTCMSRLVQIEESVRAVGDAKEGSAKEAMEATARQVVYSSVEGEAFASKRCVYNTELAYKVLRAPRGVSCDI